MCRYGMSTYKPHFACFSCRKTFKRRLLNDVIEGYSNRTELVPAKCPQCGELMADMGLDFEAPKKKDIKAWKHMANLYHVGQTFHSCGCSGPGYIPRDTEELINHLARIKSVYLKHQHFWAQRRENPETQSEIAKDQDKNRSFFYRIPNEMIKGTKNKPQYDSLKAQEHWNNQVLNIEKKIAFLKRGDKL